MRQVTFEYDVPLANGLTFRLVERRTLTEENLMGRKNFDAFVERIRSIGILYKIEEQVAPIYIDGTYQ